MTDNTTASKPQTNEPLDTEITTPTTATETSPTSPTKPQLSPFVYPDADKINRHSILIERSGVFVTNSNNSNTGDAGYLGSIEGRYLYHIGDTKRRTGYIDESPFYEVDNAVTLGSLNRTIPLAAIDDDKKSISTIDSFYSDRMSFGWFIEPTVQEDNRFFFSQGWVTDPIEIDLKKGNAVYLGDAYWENKQLFDGITEAKASFNVDFDAKTVEGEISKDKHILSLPTAEIYQNHFYNNWVGSPSLRGYFYGYNGEMIGGLYEDKDNVAVFGAIEQ